MAYILKLVVDEPNPLQEVQPHLSKSPRIPFTGFNRLRALTKNSRYEDEIYYIWCASSVVYFLLVLLTLIRNIMDYQWRAVSLHVMTGTLVMSQNVILAS